MEAVLGAGWEEGGEVGGEECVRLVGGAEVEGEGCVRLVGGAEVEGEGCVRLVEGAGVEREETEVRGEEGGGVVGGEGTDEGCEE